MSRFAALSLIVLAACKGGRDVAVRVSVTGPDSAESPVPGASITAVPFDRDSLFADLERKGHSPRPDTRQLDSLLALARAPFAELAEASRLAAALRDSAPAGPADSARLSAARIVADRRVAAARTAIDAVRSATSVRIDSIRLRMTQWENSTYASYESIANGRLRGSGRDATPDTTGADGWAHLRLPPGDWWLYATSWDVGDPNRYWYWNIRVAGDTVRLDSRHGTRRIRF